MGRGRGSIDVRRLAVRPLAHPHSRGWVTPSTLFDVDPSVLKIIQSHAIKTSPGDVALSASMSPGGAHIMVVPNGTIYEIRDTDHTTVMKEILTAIGRYPKLQQSSTIDSFHRHYLELGRRIHRDAGILRAMVFFRELSAEIWGAITPRQMAALRHLYKNCDSADFQLCDSIDMVISHLNPRPKTPNELADLLIKRKWLEV